jgi:hypothetical protein
VISENKLMQAAQASEEYVIMKSKKSLVSSCTTSGVYSQKQLSSPTTRTSVQRQYFVKIQRGKIDAEKLLFLRSLYQSAVQLKLCMSKLYS